MFIHNLYIYYILVTKEFLIFLIMILFKFWNFLLLNFIFCYFNFQFHCIVIHFLFLIPFIIFCIHLVIYFILLLFCIFICLNCLILILFNELILNIFIFLLKIHFLQNLSLHFFLIHINIKFSYIIGLFIRNQLFVI